jgi:O-antigen/teichoic acid export membrane protein
VYLSWKIDTDLWKRMMRYGTPIMVAGIAFAINEQFDKILLSNCCPDIAEAEVRSLFRLL